MTDDAPRTRRRAWIGWTVFGVLVVLVVGTGWVAIRAIGAATSLSAAAEGVHEIRLMVADRDLDELDMMAVRVAANAANARTLAADPVWRAVEWVPWLGADLRALRQVSEAADDIAADGIGPLLAAAHEADLTTIGFSGARLTLDPLTRIGPDLAEATKVLQRADLTLREVGEGGTALSAAARDLADELRTVSRGVAMLSGAADLLPDVLGPDVNRTYLLVLRGTPDGVPSATALLQAKGGTVSLGAPAPPSAALQEAAGIPSFPLAAPEIITAWSAEHKGAIDGVIALDTAAVLGLLGVTGPLVVDDVELTAENALDALRDAPDALFAHTVTALFARLTDGGTTSGQLLAALATAGDDGELHVWSADEAFQERLLRTDLAGS